MPEKGPEVSVKGAEGVGEGVAASMRLHIDER
jgi:hypothetical protein